MNRSRLTTFATIAIVVASGIFLYVAAATWTPAAAGGPASSPAPATRPSTRPVEPGDEAMLDACTKQLLLVHKALAAYEAENGRLPDQLSDIVPKYLADKAALHCPADPTDGSPGRDFAHKDPGLPVSYSYEFSADISRGLPTPLGKFPKADVGDAWGTCRNVMTHEATFFGDQVPVVRCFHHKTNESPEEKVLNLTRAGRVYRAHGVWEDHPDSVAAVLERVSADLAMGDGKGFAERWYLWRLREYLSSKPEEERYKPLHPQFKVMAERLSTIAPTLPDDGERLARRFAGLLYRGVGAPEQALAELRTSMRLGAARGDYAPGKWTQDWSDADQDANAMANLLHDTGRHEEALFIWLMMTQKRPQNGYYARRVAQALDLLGAKEAAERWHDQHDPGRALVGKPAPDFDLPLHGGGGQVVLKDLLKTRKAVLVNFWFNGCGPCHQEAPHLQKLYTELKDKGLEVVAINLADQRVTIDGFIKKHNLTFKVALGGQDTGKESVFGAFGANAYPANYLIGPDGKIVWRGVGFSDEQIDAIREELGKLGVK